MRVRPYYELVRLPNVIAAPADSLAGMLLAGGTLASWPRALPLALTSACLYAAGMALNDVFDIKVDCVERPGRPLPSGRVSLRTAAILAAILTAAGLGFALLTGSSRCVWVATGVAACIVGYDAYFKKTPLGPFVMGLCRGGNLLLGMSVIPGALGLVSGVAVVSMTLFVAGVTWISRSEVGGGRSRGVLIGVVLENVGLLGCLYAALVRGFPNAPTDLALIPLEGLLILLAGAFFVNNAAACALREATPAALQNAVKTGVRTIAVLDAGLVAAARGPLAALPIFAIMIVSLIYARRFYVT